MAPGEGRIEVQHCSVMDLIFFVSCVSTRDTRFSLVKEHRYPSIVIRSLSRAVMINSLSSMWLACPGY